MDDQYIVIESRNLPEFVAAINEYMANGYAPIGGVCVVSQTYKSRGDWENELMYFQAMTKP